MFNINANILISSRLQNVLPTIHKNYNYVNYNLTRYFLSIRLYNDIGIPNQQV